MEHRVVTDYTNVNVENDCLKVYVRARPPQDVAKVPEDMFTLPSDQPPKRLVIRDVNNKNYGEHAFMFDRVFWTEEDQETVYNEVALPLINHCFEGYHSCCFAYGQTGSGKTYSMFGEAGASRGIIPRSVEYVFSVMEERSRSKDVAVLVSFLEMYCDEIRDLGKAYLDKNAEAQKTSDLWMEARSSVGQHKKRLGLTAEYRSQNLEIREDAHGNVFVQDLSVIPVTTPEEVITIVQMGFRLRATHETKMNAVSSRSHTVFTMTLVQKDKATQETVTGMLHFVDLAGSERLAKSESEGQRLREALHINSSLSALGKVVMALDPSVPRQYVPYRDSKLTRLLQNSVGGNSFTALLATVHPRSSDYEECLSTLQFANRCRNVRNQPRVNYLDQTGADKERRIKRLQAEVADLRRHLAGFHHAAGLRLALVLKELGVEGEMLPDGRFRAADGRIIGISHEQMMAEGQAAADGSFGVADAIMQHTGFMGTQQEASQNEVALRKRLEAEQRHTTQLKAKLEAKRVELETVKAQCRAEVDNVRNQYALLRKAAAGDKETLAKVANEVSSKLESQRGVHEHEVQSLLHHSEVLMSDQARLIQKIPDALRVNSQLLQKAADAERRIREDCRRQLDEAVADVRASADREIEAERQKFEAWKRSYEEDMQKMRDEAAEYHQRRRTQVAEYQRELEVLVRYSHKAGQLLQSITTGQYPIRQLPSGSRTFALPPGAVPQDPLKGLALSKFTATLREALAAEQTTAPTPRSALDVVRQARAEGGWTDGIKAGNTEAPARPAGAPRPSTTPRSRATQSASGLVARPADDADTDDGTGGNNGMLKLSLTRSFRDLFAELDLHEPVDTMDAEGMREHIAELRKFIQTGLFERIEQQVLNDLASHDTVHYIRSLEERLAAMQALAKDESQKLRDLRVAFAAQTRTLDKLKAGSPMSTARPSSARPSAALRPE